MQMQDSMIVPALLIAATLMLGIAHGLVPQQIGCNYDITSSGSQYTLENSICSYSTITFASGVSNSALYCVNSSFSTGSTIAFNGSNTEDYLFNCSFESTKMVIGNNSQADIVSPISTYFSPYFKGSNSSVTVGYFLNISVFEPFGSNSVAMFGNRIGAFPYIIPLMNNTIRINNTQLQMQPSFSGGIINLVSRLNKTMQFGVYGQNQTQIYENVTHRDYGNIFGTKKFMIPEYKITEKGTTNYNPYAIEYSFLAYDQLVMYFLNITKNTNLMPVYIEPIYPKFNFKYVPDNGKKNMTIKWLVAVPPQDMNWNFTAYIYRYSTSVGFTMNPIGNATIPGTSLVKLLSFPSKNYSAVINGTYMFYLNYTSPLGIGVNSSIMMLPGRIPGEGSFIQDSTTPSFSHGFAMCATMLNETYPNSIINESGTYTMTERPLPVLPTAPVLANGICYIGGYIEGNNIAINCNNGTIYDSGFGFIVESSNNVSMRNCNIMGNGIMISNSTNVSIYNTTIVPTVNGSASGIIVNFSSGINFYSTKVLAGFANPYSESNSTGVNFYNSSVNATAPGYTLPTEGGASGFSYISEHQNAILYASSAVLVLIYIYLFFKLQYKPSRQKHATRSAKHTRK